MADVGPDITLDTDEPLLIEDDARRHDVPPEALRRRIYTLDRVVHRWYPPSRPMKGRRFWFLPYVAPSLPADRVVLLGDPAPVPGDRFVAFDETGRLAVLEATGETCPPDVEHCITCPDDIERRHWARVIDGSLGDRDFAYVLGPFTADEPLPSPRSYHDIELVRGRWELTDPIDLDGDGAFDLFSARADCHPGRRCSRIETWRRHEHRWYAEPKAPTSPVAPMHLLELLHLGDGQVLSYFGPERSIGGRGTAVVLPSDIDDTDPVAGDYLILANNQSIGRLRVPDGHKKAWCLFHGPTCHEAELIEFHPPRRASQLLVAGPIPDGVTVRTLDLPKLPRHLKHWDPNRPVPEFTLDLSDGTHWTVTSRPCLEETPEHIYNGTCFETTITRPGVPPHRHLVGSFTILHSPVSTPICRSR